MKSPVGQTPTSWRTPHPTHRAGARTQFVNSEVFGYGHPRVAGLHRGRVLLPHPTQSLGQQKDLGCYTATRPGEGPRLATPS